MLGPLASTDSMHKADISKETKTIHLPAYLIHVFIKCFYSLLASYEHKDTAFIYQPSKQVPWDILVQFGSFAKFPDFIAVWQMETSTAIKMFFLPLLSNTKSGQGIHVDELDSWSAPYWHLNCYAKVANNCGVDVLTSSVVSIYKSLP